jgi:hypothetical protein
MFILLHHPVINFGNSMKFMTFENQHVLGKFIKGNVKPNTNFCFLPKIGKRKNPAMIYRKAPSLAYSTVEIVPEEPALGSRKTKGLVHKTRKV